MLPRASRASSRNTHRALCQSWRASIAWTSAPGVMGSALLEVVFDPLGLAEQERDVLLGHLQELLEDGDRLFELLGEPVVLLVPPGVPEGQELGVERRQVAADVAGEDLQVVGE